jgi:two-component system, response regulator YesN
MKIMVVDDERLILNGLLSIIKREESIDCDVTGFSDSMEALQAMKTNHPDLLITDIKMPKSSGLDLIREARKNKLCRHFVIITGYDEFEFARQALRYQVIDYLLKPIRKEDLIDIIKMVEKDILASEKEADGGLANMGNPDVPILNKYANEEGYSVTLRRILRYVKHHYAEDMSLVQIGEKMGLHPNYICTLFRKEMKTTFLEYLMITRLNKATQILSTNDEKSIHQVSRAVGFLNDRQFYKIFKKYVNMTPGKFRETYCLANRQEDYTYVF